MIIIKQLFMPCYALQDILIGLARAGMRFQARQLQKAAAIKIGIFWAEDRSVSIGLRRGNPGIISIEDLIQAWGAMPAVWQRQPRESSNHKATQAAQSVRAGLYAYGSGKKRSAGLSHSGRDRRRISMAAALLHGILQSNSNLLFLPLLELPILQKVLHHAI